jgi:hypothetical protein
MEVAGVHEFVGNALNMKGQSERKTDLRGEPYSGSEENGGNDNV